MTLWHRAKARTASCILVTTVLRILDRGSLAGEGAVDDELPDGKGL